MAKAKNTTEFTPEITKELQDAVKSNKKITHVFFDENNNHYFHKHSVKVHETDKDGFFVSSKDVESCPGATMGNVKFKNGANNGFKTQRVNIDSTPVAKTLTREEVLSSEAVAKSLTEKEEDELVSRASEVMKKRKALLSLSE